MPTRLPEFPAPAERPTRYPWSQWLDGSIWSLTQGIDFHVSPKSFQSAAYLTAKRRGFSLRTQIDGDVVVIQCIAPEEEQ